MNSTYAEVTLSPITAIKILTFKNLGNIYFCDHGVQIGDVGGVVTVRMINAFIFPFFGVKIV